MYLTLHDAEQAQIFFEPIMVKACHQLDTDSIQNSNIVFKLLWALVFKYKGKTAQYMTPTRVEKLYTRFIAKEKILNDNQTLEQLDKLNFLFAIAAELPSVFEQEYFDFIDQYLACEPAFFLIYFYSLFAVRGVCTLAQSHEFYFKKIVQRVKSVLRLVFIVCICVQEPNTRLICAHLILQLKQVCPNEYKQFMEETLFKHATGQEKWLHYMKFITHFGRYQIQCNKQKFEVPRKFADVALQFSL